MKDGETVLVVGAAGQIGTDLVEALRLQYGGSSVIATDVKAQGGALSEAGPFYVMDILDAAAVGDLIKKNNVKQVYLLAALLSATAEQKVKAAWRLNMDGLLNVLDICREHTDIKLFWPSSIAVFGPTTPSVMTPQHTVMEPTTVYGISKQTGERWCEYYHAKYGVDVRSIRYPGLISYRAHPGGGTTDYAVDIYHQALDKGSYTCYLREDSTLPMMYMPDAIRATLELMHAPASQLKVRSSYNLGGISFNPAQIAASIRKHISEFTIDYKPDFRQQIADSWPASIDDTEAKNDWHWKPEYDLDRMTSDMLLHLKENRHPA